MYLKYIPIPILIFLAHQGDYEHGIVQPWLPAPHNYKFEQHKVKIPLIIHHKE